MEAPEGGKAGSRAQGPPRPGQGHVTWVGGRGVEMVIGRLVNPLRMVASFLKAPMEGELGVWGLLSRTPMGTIERLGA